MTLIGVYVAADFSTILIDSILILGLESLSTVQSAYAQIAFFPGKTRPRQGCSWAGPGISGRNPILGLR